MFKELAPIVATGTTLCIMVSAAPEGNLMVTVIPQGKDPNSALNTPLSVTATPEELDAEFPGALTGYTSSRASLAESLENAKTIMEAAGKTARDAASKAATKPTSAPAGAEDDEDGGEEDTNLNRQVAAPVSKATSTISKKEEALSLF